MAVSWTVLTGLKTVSGSIANFVNRSDLPTTNILLEAESMIYERLRVREMTARSTAFAFDAGVQTEALPSGFLDPISFTPYEWGVPLPFVHEDTLGESRDEDGVLETGAPSRWTIIGETAYVDVLPTTACTGVMLYYKRPDALSSSNETNWLTIRYPSLLRYACMAKAYEHMKDGKAGEYLQLTMASISEASMTNEMWRRGQYIPS